MTTEDFRRVALSMPGASESAHMGHPDFRVHGKIFATLGSPGPGWGMVKLDAAQQREFVLAKPGIFAPVKGAWGVQGATNVHLGHADEESVRDAMLAACGNLAPKPRRR